MIEKHNNRRAVRQRTVEGMIHQNSEEQNAPVTAAKNKPITTDIEHYNSNSVTRNGQYCKHVINSQSTSHDGECMFSIPKPSVPRAVRGRPTLKDRVTMSVHFKTGRSVNSK